MGTEQFYTVVFNDNNEQLFIERFAHNSLVCMCESLSILKVVDHAGASKMLKDLKKSINHAQEKSHIMDRVVVYKDGPVFTEREGEAAKKFFDIENYKIIPLTISY
jgi:hypothetical protein